MRREAGLCWEARLGWETGLREGRKTRASSPDLNPLKQGLEGPLDLGKGLGGSGELERVDPPALCGVDGEVHVALPLVEDLGLDPEGRPPPHGEAREGLALYPEALGLELGVQLGQALEVLPVEGLEVPLEGVGDGVELSPRGVEEGRRHPSLDRHLPRGLKPRRDGEAHPQGWVLVDLPLAGRAWGHGRGHGARKPRARGKLGPGPGQKGPCRHKELFHPPPPLKP